MATTATIMEASPPSDSFMLPGMASPEADAYSRVVRFDNECVVIPEASKLKRPMVLTKSYSLPLWKRKGHQQLSDSDVEDGTRSSSARSPSPEESRLVIKVPIPTFGRRSSASPTRGRSVSASPVVPNKLPPCLVHRSPSMSPPVTRSMPLSPVRRPSLPIYHRRKDELTVPLRACCQACERITEECLKEGELWQEKFSRGAKRRRSASLDCNDITLNSLTMLPPHRRTGSFSKEFSAQSMGLDNVLSAETDSAPSRYGKFALTVDEVDKRRKSIDLCKEKSALEQFRTLSPPSPGTPSFTSSSQVFHSPGSPYSGAPRHPRSRSIAHDRDLSSTSTASISSSTSSAAAVDELLPDILDPRHRLRSSPIQEEDEAQLFPLPRRSPNASPKVSPVPSPNTSTFCLPVVLKGTSLGISRSASASSSKESIAEKNSSQESVLKPSLSRKTSSSGVVHLAPPTVVSSSTPRPTSPSSTPPGSYRAPSYSLPLAASTIATATPITARTPTSATLTPKRISTHGLKIATAPNAEERATTSLVSPKGPRPSPPRVSAAIVQEPVVVVATALVPSSEGGLAATLASASTSPLPTKEPSLKPLVPVRLSTIIPPSPSPSDSSSTTSSSTSIITTTTTSSPIPIPIPAPLGSPTTPTHRKSRSSNTIDSTPTAMPNSTHPPHPHPHMHMHIHLPSPFHVHQSSASSSFPPSPPAASSSVIGSTSVMISPTSPYHNHHKSQQEKRKLSFTAPFIKAGEAIRDVSVDVLKGVSTISGAGVVGNI